MKTAFKLFRIIALAAAIVFSMTSCLSFGSSGSSTGRSSNTPPVEWPSQADWEQHGVSGGLQ